MNHPAACPKCPPGTRVKVEIRNHRRRFVCEVCRLDLGGVAELGKTPGGKGKGR
jgi:hypothetical protein